MKSYPVMWGLFHRPWHKDPGTLNNQDDSWKGGVCFLFSWLTWIMCFPLRRQGGIVLSLGIQSPLLMMIGVYSHLRNGRYLGSMKPFSVSVSQVPLECAQTDSVWIIVDANLGESDSFVPCHTCHDIMILRLFFYTRHGPLNVVVDVGFTVFSRISFKKNFSPLKTAGFQ